MAVAVAQDVRDPRLVFGAYIRRDTRLLLVVGLERDSKGDPTGKIELENALTLHRYGEKLDVITGCYELVKAAPKVEVPAHLDEQMAEHCKAAGL